MVSTFSPNLNFVEQGTGDNNGTWGEVLNAGAIDLIDYSIAGLYTINSVGGTVTLTPQDGAADDAREAIINVIGALTSNLIIVAPAVTKEYVISNNTSEAYTVSIQTTSASTVPLVIAQSTNELVYSDATSFYSVASALAGTASGPIDMNDLLFDRPSVKRYKEIFYDNGNISGSVTIDYFNGNCQKMTLVGNVTITLANFPNTGAFAGSLTLKCVQDGTGSRILTTPAAVKVPGGGNIVLSTPAGSVDIVYFYTDDNGSTYDATIQKAFS